MREHGFADSHLAGIQDRGVTQNNASILQPLYASPGHYSWLSL
jgi:hypothetical protein